MKTRLCSPNLTIALFAGVSALTGCGSAGNDEGAHDASNEAGPGENPDATGPSGEEHHDRIDDESTASEDEAPPARADGSDDDEPTPSPGDGVSPPTGTSLTDWELPAPGTVICDTESFTSAERSIWTNIGSKAFTWITGTIEQARYEPIGELAIYFGFAQLRTEIRDNGGPLADEGVRGAAWQVVLEHLNLAQRGSLYETSTAQTQPFHAFLDERVALVDEIWGLKDGVSPDFTALNQHISAMGKHEAAISTISARGFGELILSLSSEQQALFDEIRLGTPAVVDLVGQGPYAAEVSAELRALDSDAADMLTETASKFLAYATGDLDDALFLPPGKIGNYFGFASYRYEDRATANRSDAASFMWDVLDQEQEALLCQLAKEGAVLEGEYIAGRAALIEGIYPLRSGSEVNEESVQALYMNGATSEGRMGVLSAYYFEAIERMLSPEQLDELERLRAGSTQ